MSNYHDEKYDQIKSLLNKSRLLKEQVTIQKDNIAKSIEDKIDQDNDEYETAKVDKKESPDDVVQKYRISGGIISMHGKEKGDVEITSEEKLAFQETMDEFVDEVSDMVDFYPLNVYPTSVEWSGKVIDQDLEFYYAIGENNGVYVNGTMIRVDDEFLDFITKLRTYYKKFKTKWAKVLASRKKTQTGNNE
jgi:hypothetical protein